MLFPHYLLFPLICWWLAAVGLIAHIAVGGRCHNSGGTVT